MIEEAEAFAGSAIQRELLSLDSIYNDIEKAQTEWKRYSPMQCPDGCGQCCEDFEPDVLECEAIYLAAWILFNQKEKAESILNGKYIPPRALCGDSRTGCFLFDPSSPFHCTVYGGRTLICRLFGYSGDTGKDGRPRWKPCRFIPNEKLLYKAEHKQYTADELIALFGSLPPVMAGYLSQAVSLNPDFAGETRPLHIALPEAIAKLKMILQFLSPDEPEPEPNAPQPTSPVAA